MRRVVLWFTALVALAAVAGFGYESVARQDDGTRHPSPGRLVRVGEHRLHITCTGGGTPTVVLEAGLAESSASWAGIQRGLAGSARVCAYDRAGYAWSEDGPEPRTAWQAAGELRALLTTAGERGPYVLAGHSYGGNIVRIFADRWPDLTAGLVLIDVTDETADDAMSLSRPLLATAFTTYGLLARAGLLRLAGDALVPGEATAFARAHAPVVYGDRSMHAARAEAWSGLDSAEQVRTTVRPGVWGDRPVAVVVPSGQPDTALDRARRLAALSSRGRLVIAGTAEHYVQAFQPALVIDTIRDVASG
ncbi:pimeloyl-ACP methyl ester carboxylesterase [Nonomuraea polychroma]|uniref:Pimeloyl-ACP methyl ester carboxylesterase n=1 Tax=Nonomuraea polychroma TaxID=46176 RepID=A0A438LZU1_9ACTN|nr:pimeloyl-ACP methyl ester carboxylesterase [Nonomuraea polychroma]